MPATGGSDSEPIAQAKLLAPHAFRHRLERAIIADDYAVLAGRHRKLQRAAAALRWTGSWYEAAVAIDPTGGEEPSLALLSEIERMLYRYRRIGHDLAVYQADYVAIDVQLHVCVLPHYQRGHVEAALLDRFSNRLSNDGRPGFFHPDALSFGEPIYLSKIIAAAQAVPGVQSVRVEKLQRYGEPAQGEIEDGLVQIGPMQIARLDNDPNYLDHGVLTLALEGGR
jgi:predicted phage baseplate assembly protein